MDYREQDSLVKQQLRNLQNQAVRDLAWCCLSPPLIANLPTLEHLSLSHENLWTWLYQLDNQPDALLDLINQRKSTRLGLYYESLWQFYFLQRPEWELLAYNQQIHHQHTTVGAFDFLCRQGDAYWHVETAVKFYLCAATSGETASNWDQWIGPNKSDRLDLKLEHLHQHQMPLSQHPVAREWLRKQFPQARCWKNALCFQGYFFQHDDTQHPANAHEQHCRGKWLTLEEFELGQYRYSTAYWFLVERHLWLSPAQTRDTTKLLSTERIQELAAEQLISRNQPMMVARMKDWESVWQEEERIFLVPNHWPHIASR